MNALVRKEIQLVWPAWVAAFCLAVLPPRILETPGAWLAWLYLFGLGATILSVVPLGRELSLGTFSGLLSQPVERRRLWRVKLSVLAVALGSVLAGFVFSSQIRILSWSGPQDWNETPALAALLALLAFSGGLWTTLLLRHAVASAMSTVLAPVLISMAILGLLDRCPLPTNFGIWWLDQGPRPVADGICVAVLGLYSLFGVVWARKLFLRAEDTQWTGGAIALPTWRRARAAAASTEKRPRPGPVLALLGKELQLHQVTVLLAGGLAVLQLAVLLLLKLGFFHPNSTFQQVLEMAWGIWLAVPLVAGCSAVAEERRLGTLEAHLCLPVSRRRQGLLKFSVVLGLGLLLGAMVPWLLEGLRTGLGVGAATANGPFGGGMLAGLAAASALIALLSFYASTLTRNTVEALGASVLMLLAGFVVVALASNPGGFFGFQAWLTPPAALIGWPVMLLTVAWLAARNFKHLHPGGGVWLRNFFTLAAALVVTLTLSTALYLRAWEYLPPAEPGHGAARIPSSGTCKLEAGGGSIAVLVPDGRLWLGQLNWRRGFGALAGLFACPFVVQGRFVTASNWVDVAATPEGCVGIQRDGSLWHFSGLPPRQQSAPVKPDRIGAGNNWKAVAAGPSHYLALQKDGTLWAWGADNYGQLGDGQQRKAPARVSAPAQVGSDSDWTAVFASSCSSFAVKSDGSLWRWGLGLVFTKNPGRFGTTGRPERWEDFPKERLLSLDAAGPAMIAVGADGTMFYPIFNAPGGSGTKREFTAQMVRLPDDWKQASVVTMVTWGNVAALKKDGSLWRWDLHLGAPTAASPTTEPERLSRHADWVALSHNDWIMFALAADGGLWTWPGLTFEPNALLLPSRRPHQLANIFE